MLTISAVSGCASATGPVVDAPTSAVKVDPYIRTIAATLANHESKLSSDLSVYSTQLVSVDADGRIFSEIHLQNPNAVDMVVDALKECNGKVRDVWPNHFVIEGWIPYRCVASLAAIESVATILLPAKPMFNKGE
jgi:hypothetical protein